MRTILSCDLANYDARSDVEFVLTILITSGKLIPERGYFEKRCNFLHMVHINPVKMGNEGSSHVKSLA